jgi:hypothetical protein
MKRVTIASDESIKANLTDWLNNASRLNVKSGKRLFLRFRLTINGKETRSTQRL